MRLLAGLLTATTLVGGGIAVEDITSADLVATLNDPITLGQAMKFHAPSHHVEVSDNGLIELVVGGDTRYGIMPSKAAEQDKALFLDIESKEQEVTIKNAFGTGSEIIIKNTPTSFSKVVSFTEDYLKSIPKDAKYVEVSFDLSGWSVPDGTYTERIQLQQDVWLEKTLAWDSSEGDPNQNYTDVEFVIENGTLTKRIPVDWLKTALFPIYTDATFTFGAKALADAGPSGSVDVLPIGNDKAAICWPDDADGTDEGQCIIASISGTTPSFGSVVNFAADTINPAGNGNEGIASACSAGPDRWVVVYNEDSAAASPDLGKARVASSTGTVINGYGTALTFNNATTTFPTCTQVSTDAIVITYATLPAVTGNLLSRVFSIACTIGNDYTLTCGTAVPLSHQRPTSLFAEVDCDTLEPNKFICMYAETNAAPTDLYANAGSVSGTTLTIGATSTLSANSVEGTRVHSIIAPSQDKFAYHYDSGGGASPLRMGLATISGTNITLGATSTIIATTTSYSSLTALDNDDAFLFYQQGVTDAATTFTAAIPIQLNWSTLTFSTSSAETVDATTDPGSLHAAKIGDCKILFAWEDDNDTNDLFAKVATCASSFSPWQWHDF